MESADLDTILTDITIALGLEKKHVDLLTQAQKITLAINYEKYGLFFADLFEGKGKLNRIERLFCVGGGGGDINPSPIARLNLFIGEDSDERLKKFLDDLHQLVKDKIKYSAEKILPVDKSFYFTVVKEDDVKDEIHLPPEHRTDWQKTLYKEGFTLVK